MKNKSPIEQKAHKHSSNHKDEVLSSQKCGCFFCIEIFTPDAINEWVDGGRTALCPYCGIDSLIGDKSEYPVTKNFLKSMNKVWF